MKVCFPLTNTPRTSYASQKRRKRMRTIKMKKNRMMTKNLMMIRIAKQK